jgi:hypothetical protein
MHSWAIALHRRLLPAATFLKKTRNEELCTIARWPQIPEYMMLKQYETKGALQSSHHFATNGKVK